MVTRQPREGHAAASLMQEEIDAASACRYGIDEVSTSNLFKNPSPDSLFFFQINYH